MRINLLQRCREQIEAYKLRGPMFVGRVQLLDDEPQDLLKLVEAAEALRSRVQEQIDESDCGCDTDDYECDCERCYAKREVDAFDSALAALASGGNERKTP